MKTKQHKKHTMKTKQHKKHTKHFPRLRELGDGKTLGLAAAALRLAQGSLAIFNCR